MPPLRNRLRSAPVVGVSGSRSPGPACVAACRSALQLVASGSAPVVTGCASGIDARARASVPASRLVVLRASSFGRGAWAFARRSAACVQHVQSAGGLWLSFPSATCPPVLSPHRSVSRCFCGSGSGSWATLALARGRGLPCVLFLPLGLASPSGWGFSALGSGWHFASGSDQQPLAL